MYKDKLYFYETYTISIKNFLIAISILVLSSCEKGEYRCEAGNSDIIGAECNDGTSSDATGSGACSSHDGVDYWICCCED